MIDIKCPYCNKTLHCGATLKADECLIDLYQCVNEECESTEFLVGCKEFWDILEQHRRTRKALDIAKDKLDTVRQYHRGTAVIRSDDIATYCDRAIEQITALDKKESK